MNTTQIHSTNPSERQARFLTHLLYTMSIKLEQHIFFTHKNINNES